MTVEDFHSLLDYNHNTGIFTWKVNRRGSVKAGDVAGKINGKGYRQIKILGVSYMAHRLAWLFVNGRFPVYEIDHINRDPLDNRISNLREAKRIDNCRNVGGWSNKKSGLPHGVTYDKSRGKFIARASCNGVSKNLGRFDTVEDASMAAKKARMEFYGVFAPN